MPELDALNALQRLEHGELIEKLYEAINEVSDEVTRAAQKTGAGKITKGKVTLTLDIEHDRGWDDLQIVVLGQITKGVPKTQPQGATFFAFQGSLWRDNPRADPLPAFREVVRQEPTDRDIEPASVAASREV